MTKTQIYKILFLIIFLVFSTIFIVFYEAILMGFQSEIGGENYNFLRVLVSAIVAAIIGASILGSIDVVFLSKILRKSSFGLTLAIKTVVYVTLIIIFVSIVRMYLAAVEFHSTMFSQEVIEYHLDFLFSPRIIITIIYWGMSCTFGLFILQVSDKFGQGVLLNFILGKYHRPKEEERIFMFLDLKSSTVYAEKLGHIKYSQLIQDCFFDLTEVVVKNEAKIYQYVGDEVVLSWECNRGISHNNCIKIFFDYKDVIAKRSKRYTNEYGFVPEFKAGLSVGFVTVAEVGVLKKELAYHGAVLNTASRIQGVCNMYDKSLLISAHLEKMLNLDSFYKKELIGSIELKGKQHPVEIFSIEKLTDSD